MKKTEPDEHDKSTENIKYYKDFSQDVIESAEQDHGIPESYKWFHTNLFYRFCAAIVYAIAIIFGVFYVFIGLHVRVKNRKALKACKETGGFLYGNHTLPMGDVFAPAMYAFPKRIYTVVSAANLGVPVIGKILPMLGALVVPEKPDDMKKFIEGIKYHIDHKRVVIIYPEAHQWPYCGFIRPFDETSFGFPVMYDAPAFCFTTTFQKRRFGKKPKITTYIDGPFYPDMKNGRRNAKKKLCDEVYECMRKRSENTTYEYVKYRVEKS